MQAQVKSHTRKRKNGVSVVRRHSRRKFREQNIKHPITGNWIKRSSVVKTANSSLKEGGPPTSMHNWFIKVGLKLHRNPDGSTKRYF